MKKLALVLFAGMLACALFAEDPLAALRATRPKGGTTTITSDTLEFNYKDFVALFDGNVRVEDPQFTLTADKMLIFFDKTNEVRRLDAIGDVKVVSDDRTGSCGRAIYTRATGTIVLQGDPALVEIKAFTPNNSPFQNTAATITLTHPPVLPFPVAPAAAGEKPLMTSRVDIGVFVHNGVHWSPPALLSFYYPPNEERLYDANSRLVKVDYAKAFDNYADPVLTLPKRWIDVYQYDDAGNRLGFERWRGNLMDSFTADGFKVLTRDVLKRPATARVVEYLPRTGAGPSGGIELSESETTRTVTYTYKDAHDQRGTFKENE